MSLINDALQRAKQQTVQTAPAPNLQLRPAEPTQERHRRSPVMLTLVFAAVVIVAGAATPLVLNGRNNRSEAIRPVPTPTSASVQASAPLKADTAVVAAQVPTVVVSNTVPAAAAAPATVETPVISETKPAPPAIKLNGIFFHARNPSAILNGKTVYTNGRVGEFRVASITPASVVLINASTTNILSLEE